MDRFNTHIIIGCFLVGVTIFFASCNTKDNLQDNNETETQTSVSIISEESTSVQTEETQPEFDYEAAREQYTAKCHDYNNAISNYNQEMSRIASLIESLKTYNITVQYGLSYKDLISLDIDDESLKEMDLGKYDNYIQEITDETEKVKSDYYEICSVGYEQITVDYNTLVDAYNTLVEKTSIDFISDVPHWVGKISKTTYDINIKNFSKSKYINDVESIYRKVNELAINYQLVKQITAPNEKWVSTRLECVDSITGQMAVTGSNDPNQLLGKPNGGYKSCIYFTVKDIDPNTVKGNNIVDKGTDAGGCIESYGTLEDALNRCDYLSQFDNTLLYSGSYVIVGTMVVRTSYKLTDKQQVDLTNEIIRAFTAVDAS